MNRPELTYEEFSDLPLRYVFGYSADTHAARRYINEEFGLVKETVTPRNKRTGEWGKADTCFYLVEDPVDVWYHNGAQLYEAYMAKACGVTYDGLA